jgi:hypothetical protein
VFAEVCEPTSETFPPPLALIKSPLSHEPMPRLPPLAPGVPVAAPVIEIAVPVVAAERTLKPPVVPVNSMAFPPLLAERPSMVILPVPALMLAPPQI